jgi:putative holliday junction resolvase
LADVLLGLDVGEARIGLARATTDLAFAFGRGHLKRQTLTADVAAIRQLARDEGASLVVVGLPRRTDGRDSAQTARVRAFAAALEAAGLAVALEDERFTTQLAARGVAGSGLRKRQRQEKGRVDEGAAVLILESYLARTRTED